MKNPAACFPILLTLASCLPSSGEVELFSDALFSAGSDASLVAGDGGLRDRSILVTDRFLGGELPAPPPADQGAPAGPQPPFGAALGLTAANFVNVPDCSGTLYTLHKYHNNKKGVLIAMMSPS